ncbi:hypothetical protein SteCoe_30201 [Stentor coeruleus]|uniref:Uncharacterized protein n=1 Tax=Stentor coeruleus TaxID=5963 RepID=A0A1R2B4M4_9CILI|nr:hypothetical protein SteCoe_30201 [Stentor coeruleus]
MLKVKNLHIQEKESLTSSNLSSIINKIEGKSFQDSGQINKIKEKLLKVLSYYQKKVEINDIRILESLDREIEDEIRDNVKIFEYLIEKVSKIEKKLAKVIKKLNNVKNCLGFMRTSSSPIRDKVENTEGYGRNVRILDFLSPRARINQENIAHFEDTCKRNPGNYQGKPPVPSPKHIRAQTVSSKNDSPFCFPVSEVNEKQERYSLLEISNSLQAKKEFSQSGNGERSESPGSPMLKMQLSKVINQRDKVKIENEKILLELKESKLKLAEEKEKNCEKLIMFENGFKKILMIIKKHSEIIPEACKEDFLTIFKRLNTLFF